MIYRLGWLFDRSPDDRPVRRRRHCWANPPNARCRVEAPGSGDAGELVYLDDERADINLLDGGEVIGCIEAMPRRQFDEEWEWVL